MPKQQKTYTREFKLEAVQLVKSSGKPMRVSAEGLFAWTLQHEIDHLDGILYLDRLERPEGLREVRPDDFAEEEVLVENPL